MSLGQCLIKCPYFFICDRFLHQREQVIGDECDVGVQKCDTLGLIDSRNNLWVWMCQFNASKRNVSEGKTENTHQYSTSKCWTSCLGLTRIMSSYLPRRRWRSSSYVSVNVMLLLAAMFTETENFSIFLPEALKNKKRKKKQHCKCSRETSKLLLTIKFKLLLNFFCTAAYCI